MKITDYLNNEFTQASLQQNYRMIPGIDMLKNTQRKLISYISNNPKKLKVSTLASFMMAEYEYLYGDASAQSVLQNLCVNYDTSVHTINVIKGTGTFGSRFQPDGIASPRYVEAEAAKIMNYIYKTEDRPINEYNIFEGKKIEEKYMLPVIIPLFMSQYTMGTGFASCIPARNPLSLVKYQKEWLKNKNVTKAVSDKLLMPYLKGYNGTIIHKEVTDPKTEELKHKFTFRGAFTKKNSTDIIITEVGPFESLEGYLTHLDKLIKDKVIKDYIDESDNDIFKFTIKVVGSGVDSFWAKYNTNDKVIKVLKLEETITENLTMFNEDNRLVVYESIKEYVDYFMSWRLEKYELRRLHLINQLELDIGTIEWKRNFITLVTEDKVIISKRTKADILAQLSKFNGEYPTGLNASDREKHLSLSISTLTKEKIAELDKIIKSKEKELTKLMTTNAGKMWLKDIEELEKVL